MKRLLALSAALVALAGCDATNPPEGCRGHGGVQQVGRDATNSHIPFTCKDGTVGYIDA